SMRRWSISGVFSQDGSACIRLCFHWPRPSSFIRNVSTHSAMRGAAAGAGAAVVHWHARDPVTGVQRLDDAALYGRGLELMRPSGVLAYPSYPPWPVGREDRLAHVWTLRERHGLELAPLDLGSVRLVGWDERTCSFGPGLDLLREHGVVANPLPFLLDALEHSY